MADEKKVRFGILFKMLLVMVLVSTIPLAVVWYISHNASQKAISQDVDNRLSSMADQLRSYVESWIDMNVRVMRQNAMMPDMVTMDGALQKTALEAIVKTYEWDYLAFTVDINGQNISRSDDKALKDYSDRHYVRQILGGQDLGQQVLISKTTGKPALVLSTAIKDAKQQTRGVLAIGLTLAGISDKIATVRFGETGYAVLLDPEGKVISHINEEFIKKRTSLTDHPGFQALMLGNKESVVYTDKETGKKVFSQIRKTRHGWILLVQQDYDEAFAALKTYNQQTQILMLVSVIVVLLVAVLVSRQLTRPIRRLTTAAEAISRGNFGFEIGDAKRRDELGELARAVERLGTSVRLAMERFSR